MAKGTVLVADDDASVRTVVNQAMMRAGFNVRITSSFATLWQWIAANEGDCVISDVIMPDGEAFDLLPRIRQARPELPVILISAQNTFMTALRAQEEKAFDYLPKPFDLNKLVETVRRAIEEPAAASAAARTDETYAGEMPLIGRSPLMQEIYRKIARLRHSTDPVLLSGEDGIGKSLVARVIHQFGPTAHRPFHTISLVSGKGDNLPASLFTGPGAYNTGHDQHLAREAGTLFIDDLLDLSTNAQKRLLAALSASSVPANSDLIPPLRIVSATSADVTQRLESGDFDRELYYRLSVIPIRVPALRERLEDIPDLVRHFVKKSELEGSLVRYLEPDAMQLLKDYDWPGNVRELENLIRRVCLLSGKESIGVEEISEQLDHTAHPPVKPATDLPLAPSKALGLEAIFHERYFAALPEDAQDGQIYEAFIDDYEPSLITAALRATNGNQIRAARLLGLNRNTLRKKIRDHGIRIIRTVR